jgi:hypothetical protein
MPNKEAIRDKEKQNLYHTTWRKKNKDKVKAYNDKYRADQPVGVDLESRKKSLQKSLSNKVTSARFVVLT